MTDLAHLFDAPESLALYRVKRERDQLRAALEEIAARSPLGTSSEAMVIGMARAALRKAAS